MRRGALLAAALLAAAPHFAPGARAQTRPQARDQTPERPRLEASRDFSGTYRASGGEAGRGAGTPTELQLSWLAAARVLRVERPGQGYALNDRRAGSVRVVPAGSRFAMSVPLGAANSVAGIPTEPGPGARFTREGGDTVAGLRCTLWRFTDGAHSGRLCLTADGVLLRGEGEGGGRRGRIEAVSVRLAPQDPARFRLPPGTPVVPLPPGLVQGLVPGG